MDKQKPRAFWPDTPILHVVHVAGNWYDVEHYVNHLGLAEYVVNIGEMVGNYTTFVMRIPQDHAAKLHRDKRIRLTDIDVERLRLSGFGFILDNPPEDWPI